MENPGVFIGNSKGTIEKKVFELQIVDDKGNLIQEEIHGEYGMSFSKKPRIKTNSLKMSSRFVQESLYNPVFVPSYELKKH